MSVLLEFSMFPTDHGESKSIYVSRVIKKIDESTLPYQFTPMGTIIETETIDEALALIRACYKILEPDCNRVFSTLKFDIRKGQSNRMQRKVEPVVEKLEEKVD